MCELCKSSKKLPQATFEPLSNLNPMNAQSVALLYKLYHSDKSITIYVFNLYNYFALGVCDLGEIRYYSKLVLFCRKA